MSNKIIFTQEQLDKMVQMHNDGFLNRELAEHFNVSRSTIGRCLSKMGVESRHPWVDGDREKSAIELYAKYKRLKTVGEKLKMNPDTVKAILLKNGIYVLNSSDVAKRCSINGHYFDVIDSHRKAYYLGLICADGTVGLRNNKFQISLQEQDAYIIKQLNTDLESTYKISLLEYSKKNPNWSDQYCLTTTNKDLLNGLLSQGVLPNKSYCLEFPKNLSEKYYSSFLLGYMDGDGSISKNPKDCRCSLVSTEDFCSSVAEILSRVLNVNSSILLCHDKHESVTRTLQIAGKRQVKKYLDWLYSNADIYLERKHQIYLSVYCN